MSIDGGCKYQSMISAETHMIARFPWEKRVDIRIIDDVNVTFFHSLFMLSEHGVVETSADHLWSSLASRLRGPGRSSFLGT